MARIVLAALLAFLLAAPVAAQIRVAYEVAPLAIRGNVVEFSGLDPYADPDEQESATGDHRSISATIPLASQGEGGAVGIRVAYLWFTNRESGTVTSYPGLYLNLSGATEDGAVGWAASFDIGYDYYNKEALGILGLLPTVALSVGPRLNAGPLGIEGTVGAQMTSILQGVALTARVGVALGS